MGNGNEVDSFSEGKEGKLIREEEDKDFRGGHIASEEPKVASERPLSQSEIWACSSGGMFGARTQTRLVSTEVMIMG